MTYNPPIRASHHCRHYSYERGETLVESGPRCALGVMGATIQPCMPGTRRDTHQPCPHRVEYSDEERAAYDTYVKEASARAMNALGALNDAFEAPDGSGTIQCPNCGGSLSYWRKGRHAQFMCETANCCGGYLTMRE